MGLIDLQTDLKSLKFGKDRFGGGDSGQPYIKNPIIDEPGRLTQADNDFLLRGGIRAPLNAAEDVARLTKYMFSTKSPSGLLFIAKQNLLSRVAPKTEASKGIGYGGGGLNAGVYTPLSTLAQVGIGFTGIHLNKQGIDPTGLIPGLGINKYEDIIKSQDENRLVTLTSLIEEGFSENNFNFTKGYSLNKGNSVVEYGGGPGSILGIGKTRIQFADQRTGNQNVELRNSGFFTPLKDKGYNDYSIFKNPRPLTYQSAKIFHKGVSELYKRLTNYDLIGDNFTTTNDSSLLYNFQTSVYTPFSAGTFPENTPLIGKGSWSQQDFINQPKSVDNEILEDFRTKLDPTSSPQSTFLSLSPNYKRGEGKNIEERVHLGNPGEKGDISNYALGKRNPITKTQLGPTDTINALPIYKSSNVTHKWSLKNDLVKFRIAIIDVEDPSQKYFIHFRSFIDKFSEGYKAKWKGQNYMGRAEEFYKYEGFSRDVSIDFTIVAQSKEELIPMYKKLNFLASSLAPKYTRPGYMAGNIAQLTVGGYLFEQPGIIESISYDIPEESSWEIGIPLQTPDGTKFEDSSVKELPHMIKVSISFTPIHKFRPELMSLGSTPNNGSSLTKEDILNDQNVYGNQRFISLADGLDKKTNNYDTNEYVTSPASPPPPPPNPDTLPTLTSEDLGINDNIS
jgi:hypothetical protein